MVIFKKMSERSNDQIIEDGEKALPENIAELSVFVSNLKNQIPERFSYHGSRRETLGNNIGLIVSWISGMQMFGGGVPKPLEDLKVRLKETITEKVNKANEELSLKRALSIHHGKEFIQSEFDGVSERDFKDVMDVVDEIEKFCQDHRND